jgi:RND family efflux transporter MFP subunit
LPETLIGLELEIENAELALESVRATNEARRVREAAELRSIEAEHGLAKEQLENWDRQIENGVLKAPAPGLVVYARMDWDEPVYEGMEVRERQEIILLPDVSSMLVELRVPEAQIGRLAAGQPATVQVDALAGRRFAGRVTHVSTLPDPQPGNQQLKVYEAHVSIDGENAEGALRPGMNATVTVDVGTIEDALHVPLPALERRGDVHFVWKMLPEGPVAVPVELGGNNLTHVQVLAGLAEGDRICLVRPPGSELPAEDGAPPPAENGSAESGAAGATQRGGERSGTRPGSADGGNAAPRSDRGPR